MADDPRDAGVPSDAGPAGGMGSAGISEKDFIYDAINLFKASKYFSNPGIPRRGVLQAIEKKLWSLYKNNRIVFTKMKETGTFGTYVYASDKIELDVNLKTSLSETSRILAHEGFHATRLVHENERMLNEYGARVVGTLYGTELVTDGVEFYPKIQHSKQKRVKVKLVDPQLVDQVLIQLEWLEKKQLIDYVLGKNPIYRLAVSERFVRKYIEGWGGLKNRWSTTKSAYVLAVVIEKPLNESLLLRLLESIRKSEWPVIKKRLGRYLFLVQYALSRIRNPARVQKLLRSFPDLKLPNKYSRNYGRDIGCPSGACRKITGRYA